MRSYVLHVPCTPKQHSCTLRTREIYEYSVYFIILLGILTLGFVYDSSVELPEIPSDNSGNVVNKAQLVDVKSEETIEKHLAPNRRKSQSIVEAEPSKPAAKEVVITVDASSLLQRDPCHVLLYTMQTLSTFNNPFLGELIVLQSLESSLESFQCTCHRVKDDAELNSILSSPKLEKYSLYFFDEFTFISPQHQPRVRHDHMKDRWFILDFFGHKAPHKELGPGADLSRYLTAFPSEHNTFLGFFLQPAPNLVVEKKKQGLLWGKESRYFKNPKVTEIVKRVAKKLKLISTIAPIHAPSSLKGIGIEFVGHLNKEHWLNKLAESQFVLGIGEPILGPTAVEALAYGCQFWNPVYKIPRVINPGMDDIVARTQHDGVSEVAKKEGKEEYICEYELDKSETILKCVDNLPEKLPFYLLDDFREQSHRKRVIELVKRVGNEIKPENKAEDAQFEHVQSEKQDKVQETHIL